MFPSKTLTVSIECSPREIYSYVVHPGNLPEWTAFCTSVRQHGDDWVAETSSGPISIRFAEKNDLGVLDHVVTLSTGQEVYVPMRVIPNGQGSEVLFTLYRTPDMSIEQFERDAAMVEGDLSSLKTLMERTA